MSALSASNNDVRLPIRLIGSFVRRNLRGFWRDKMSAFLSILSPMILFLLFVVFYRKSTANLIMEQGPNFSSHNAYALCDSWMFASTTTLATVSSSLGMLTTFVEDRVAGRFADYLVSPIRRWQLCIGYIFSSVIVSFIVSISVLTAGQVWSAISGNTLMTPQQDLRTAGAAALCCLLFSSLNTLVVTCLTTQGAFMGYSIIMGAITGFLSFCYVTPVNLAQSIDNVLSAGPFAQAASLVRYPVMLPALETLTSGMDSNIAGGVMGVLNRNLGVTLSIGGNPLTTPLVISILSGLTVVLAVLGSWRMSRVVH